MKTFTFTTTILLTAISGNLVKADNCTPGLSYCGHSLIAKGNYRAQLDQAYLDTFSNLVSSDVWTNHIFLCDGGRSGTVTWITSCAETGTCIDAGDGHSDFCGIVPDPSGSSSASSN